MIPQISHIYGVGKCFSRNERFDDNIIPVDTFNIGDKSNAKPLCHQRGNSVFIRRFTDEFRKDMMLIKKRMCVFSKSGTSVIAQDRVLPENLRCAEG